MICWIQEFHCISLCCRPEGCFSPFNLPGEYIKRGKVDMKQLVEQAVGQEYTDIVVINEDMKKPSILLSKKI